MTKPFPPSAVLFRIAGRALAAGVFLVGSLFARSGAADETTAASSATIRALLDKRCVVCHGCYDAPCQLKLSSKAGLDRGASKNRVYNSSRLDDAAPTRLGIDAHSVADWRKHGFFDVATPPLDSPHMGKSVLEQLLTAGRRNGFTIGAALPEDIDLDINRELSCPANGEVAEYLKDHPAGGMPYGMAPLDDKTYEALLGWAKSGAPLTEEPPSLPQDAADQIAAIEAFFNRQGDRERLVARYVYEHLFLAHLHLEGDDPRRFFRLIRSATPPGETPQEIATRRPFDDPKRERFFYRIVEVTGTILFKEHMTYEIGPKKLERYQHLFLQPTWTLDHLPPYSEATGGNPISTFKAIPAKARYQFLLDNALYFVRSFIRGPVCYGQVAVNVIEDRFWVAFLDPSADLSVTDASYLKDAAPILELPVAQSGGDLAERLESFLVLGPIRYQEFRSDRYQRSPRTRQGFTYADIWNGGGANTGARLTVFRNFSSASVVPGFVGAIPETAWVIDYPLFERIYYNLVAGFDVFGNVEHQLTTRLYMDALRREGERMFLSFLPAGARAKYHDEWYRGTFVSLLDFWKENPLNETRPTGVFYSTGDPKAEFLRNILEQGNGLWPVADPINRCAPAACASPASTAGKLRPLTDRPAPFAKFLPDVSVLIVEKTVGEPEIFSLVHDKAHSNVAFIFNEDLRREPENDTLTIVEGQFVSYPNFIFKVSEEDLVTFVLSVRALDRQRSFVSLVDRYGLRRTDADFWTTFDLLQDRLNAQDTVEAGLLDLNRYIHPKPDSPLDEIFSFVFSE